MELTYDPRNIKWQCDQCRFMGVDEQTVIEHILNEHGMGIAVPKLTKRGRQLVKVNLLRESDSILLELLIDGSEPSYVADLGAAPFFIDEDGKKIIPKRILFINRKQVPILTMIPIFGRR